MANFWVNLSGLLHDGVGFLSCNNCPCDSSSSGIGSGSGSQPCPPGCFVVGDPTVQLDEQDPGAVQGYDVIFTLTPTIVCPGESVNVVIDISEIGVGTGAFAPILGLATTTNFIALSNLTPYDAATDYFSQGSISGFAVNTPIALQYDQFDPPPREINQISFDLTLSSDECSSDTITIHINCGREIHTITLTCCPLN